MSSLALVVENDESTRKLLEVVLSRHHYEVDALTNGTDALVLLESIDYDLVILDLMLPRTSGLEILDWVQASRPGLLPRTLVLTSAPKPALDRVQRQHPAAQLMRKPFELHELLEAAKAARRDRELVIPAETRFARRSIVAGAKAGVVVRSAGAEVELVHMYGYPAKVVARWFPMSANAQLPLYQCVRDGRAQWVPSLAKATSHFPHLEPVWQENQSRALATVPLVRDGVVVGAAGWTFRDPQPFDESEQRVFMEIADDALNALESGELAGA